MTNYDHIVVGAGSAGCVVAARLAEQPGARVLLLEAGSATPAVAPPRYAWALHETEANWADQTVEQTSVGRVVEWPGGRGAGGSSAINAMVFLRGHRRSYTWGPGWSFDDLLPYFKRSETAPGRDPDLRGTSGPMIVSPARDRHPLAVAGVAAALEVGHPLAGDISGGAEEGFGWPDLSILDGSRLSTADAYLPKPGVDLVPRARVHQIVIENDRAVGVRYGTTTARCSGEVVLTAGAIGSAHLLLLSGLGPAADLRAWGVPVVADLPGVGGNLHDHALFSVRYASPVPIPVGANNRMEVVGLAGDLQFLYFTPIPLSDTFGIFFALMSPHSRGRLRLASARPDDRPLLDPRYLADSRDLDTALTGLDMARALGATRALAPWRGAEPVIPDHKAHLRASLASYYHYVGTCAIGSVVDTELRVHGIDGLRVADASVIPDIPAGNTNATVIAIAERAADLITGGASYSG